jgi:hypothetical protein
LVYHEMADPAWLRVRPTEGESQEGKGRISRFTNVVFLRFPSRPDAGFY